MKKLKKEKGITLIALIVTIIVLIILATISIGAIFGEDGIIKRAEEAKEKYLQGEQNDLDAMQSANDKIGEILGEGSSGGEEGTKLFDVVEVGDYVDYSAKLTSKPYQTDTDETGYTDVQNFTTNTNMKWRVISKKESGEVELVAVSNVLATDGVTGLYLSGQKGFLNAETVLKNMCDTMYTTSYGEGRSIKVEDINALTGFDPMTSEWGYEGEKDYYINNRTQTYTSGMVWDKESNTFKDASTVEGGITVEHTYYWYTPEETMALYDTLIEESKTYENDYSNWNWPSFYWLASQSVSAMSFDFSFDVLCVRERGRLLGRFDKW